ncbi:asparagine synthase (glutamine-hydrolyzing) [Candidatus Pelagibacter bacterium]|nr:asparagine synthase (glutamine-hydrolyzing) [Candidatus Pelagibacter bacterium]|tara:strand:+ start:2814 stop:4697 length:1884 start_codon:yes stop_codon:yes gene_type:complete
MCGIFGALGKNIKLKKNFLNKSFSLLNHRGPDDFGCHTLKYGILCHTRLSILDLDSRSNQPMTSNNDRFVLVFNGEIYNYKELRIRYLKNYNFKTSGDTEVLLALFEKFGKNFLKLLNGMFAICIYDKKKDEAFLARDAFGQKPLFYTKKNSNLFFSSEVKIFREMNVAFNANKYAWYRYLIHGSYDDNKETFFENIYQLEPGETITWKKNKDIIKNKFFVPQFSVGKSLKDNFSTASKKIKLSIKNSSKIHMRSDVPVGLCLSGGLDSSILLSCIQSNPETKNRIRSYSIEFGKSFSEKKWINLVSKQYKVKNKMINFSKKNFLTSIKPMMWFQEAPIGGLMNCALAKLMYVAQKKDKIKVMQDGSGLDELLGGYAKHQNIYLNLLKKKLPKKKYQLYFKKYCNFWNISELKAEQFLNSENKKNTAIDGTVQINKNLYLKNFINSKYSNKIKKFDKSKSKLHNELLDFLFIRKIPRNTRMRDRISMANSIELRLPFLDLELFKYSMSIKEDFYFKDGLSKSIARNAFSKNIIADVNFAHKRSVQAPQTEWLRSEPMKTYIKNLINSKSFARRGFFDVKKVKEIYKDFCKKKFNNSFFVWQWINMEEWFRMFVDKKNNKIHSFNKIF